VRYLLIIFLLSATSLSQAQIMDLETHNVLIEKINKGYDGKSKIADSVQLRLADLYADRARIKTLKEAEKENCNSCMGSKADRREALNRYFRLFEIYEGSEQERILVQIIQMNMLLDNKFAKKKFYKKIVDQKKYGLNLKGRAYLALAEIDFYDGEFKNSRNLYKNAIRLKPQLNTLLTRYRLAWCALHLGETASAQKQLLSILNNKKQLKKDPALHSDVAKDLSLFLAKGNVGQREIRQVHDLSPEGEAKENLKLLAQELTRVGQPASTTVVSQYILENFKASSIEKAQIAIQIAQAEYNLNRKAKASVSYGKAMGFYRQGKCDKTSDCSDLQEKARKMLISWRQDEKLKPTPRLVAAFTHYLASFKEDFEIAFWGGQAAESIKNYRSSQNFYQQAAVVLGKKKTHKLLEVSAVSAIRVAEASKSYDNRREAYKTYLKVLPQGRKAYETRYQLAFVDYEQKKYSAARPQFAALVKDHAKKVKGSKEVFAKKSADLVLDILALEKNNDEIIKQSQSFAKTFRKDAKEFNGIYRKAVYNQAVVALKAKSPKAMAKSLGLMKTISFRNVEEKEQIALLETQSLLAEQLRDIPEVKRTAAKLLTYKKLPAKTKDFAYQQLIWSAEVTMDFARAYSLSKTTMPAKPNKSQVLRLALLAELAGKDPRPHYETYLTFRSGTLEANQIRAKIVQSSKRPWAVIKEFVGSLKRSPQLLSEVALETYIRYRNPKAAEMVLAQGSVSKKPAGRALQRQLDIPKFEKLASQLRSHRISTASDSRTQADIAKRIDWIDQMTVIANKAIDRGDVPMKLAALTVLRAENGKLYSELMKLPVPRKLSAVEKAQYKNLLATQAKPFLIKSQEITKELGGLWNKEKYIKSLASDYRSGTLLMQKVIASEARFLVTYAPKDKKDELLDLAKSPGVNSTEVLNAKRAVQKQPFGQKELRLLKTVATYHGNSPQVAFAEQRLQQLQKETR